MYHASRVRARWIDFKNNCKVYGRRGSSRFRVAIISISHKPSISIRNRTRSREGGRKATKKHANSRKSLSAVTSMFVAEKKRLMETIFGTTSEDGADIRENEGQAIYQWLGRRVEWEEIRAMLMSQVFHKLAGGVPDVFF